MNGNGNGASGGYMESSLHDPNEPLNLRNINGDINDKSTWNEGLW